jgi:hypothetical protein
MILQQWLLPTAFAAAFFSIAPRLASGGVANPPLSMTLGFPAIVFGISPLVQYLRLRSRL